MRRIVTAVVAAAVVLGAAVWARAQFVQPEPVTPVVLSGQDIGFRMVARKGGTAVGSLVVKIDGQWVDTDLAMAVRPAAR
jgi:hypothetical protein